MPSKNPELEGIWEGFHPALDGRDPESSPIRVVFPFFYKKLKLRAILKSEISRLSSYSCASFFTILIFTETLDSFLSHTHKKMFNRPLCTKKLCMLLCALSVFATCSLYNKTRLRLVLLTRKRVSKNAHYTLVT